MNQSKELLHRIGMLILFKLSISKKPGTYTPQEIKVSDFIVEEERSPEVAPTVYTPEAIFEATKFYPDDRIDLSSYKQGLIVQVNHFFSALHIYEKYHREKNTKKLCFEVTTSDECIAQGTCCFGDKKKMREETGYLAESKSIAYDYDLKTGLLTFVVDGGIRYQYPVQLPVIDSTHQIMATELTQGRIRVEDFKKLHDECEVKIHRGAGQKENEQILTICFRNNEDFVVSIQFTVKHGEDGDGMEQQQDVNTNCLESTTTMSDQVDTWSRDLLKENTLTKEVNRSVSQLPQSVEAITSEIEEIDLVESGEDTHNDSVTNEELNDADSPFKVNRCIQNESKQTHRNLISSQDKPIHSGIDSTLNISSLNEQQEINEAKEMNSDSDAKSNYIHSRVVKRNNQTNSNCLF